MRFPFLIMVAGPMMASLLSAADTLSIFDKSWTVPSSADWKVAEDQDSAMLQLLTGREPAPGPRRPGQFALLAMASAKKLTLEVDARPTKNSLIVVFAYQDSAHFNYVHFSHDTGLKQPVHNGVFHVFGGERVRISNPAGVSAFSAVNRWYHLKVEWDGTTGHVQGFVDGKPIPALQAVDLSITEGRIGLGSFDETADFKNFRLTTMPEVVR